jgi:hypothetical protein
MKHLKSIFVLLIASCAVSAMAQVPSGSFSYSFTNVPLWDISGSYTNDISTNGYTDAAIIDLTVAAGGAVTGTRQDQITLEGVGTAEANGDITGKISVRSGVTIGTFKETGTSTGSVEDVDFTGTTKGGSIAAVDASLLTIINIGEVEVCAVHEERLRRIGCKTFKGTGSAPLPVGMDGHWTLDTTVTNSVDALSGSATLTLSNGRAFPYMVVGKYASRTSLSKLNLVGTGDATGTSLTVDTQGTNMVLVALRGKVLGQKPTILP